MHMPTLDKDLITADGSIWTLTSKHMSNARNATQANVNRNVAVEASCTTMANRVTHSSNWRLSAQETGQQKDGGTISQVAMELWSHRSCCGNKKEIRIVSNAEPVAKKEHSCGFSVTYSSGIHLSAKTAPPFSSPDAFFGTGVTSRRNHRFGEAGQNQVKTWRIEILSAETAVVCIDQSRRVEKLPFGREDQQIFARRRFDIARFAYATTPRVSLLPVWLGT
ncbi:hypothetical protein B0H12DRAFT_1079869 [Mycena haematopus]|nr:hypothetical protein B0H12DRAFT_1079869 [Mycena haematopus]